MKSRLRPEQEFTWQSGREELFQAEVTNVQRLEERRHDISGKQPQINQYAWNLEKG